MNPVGVPGERRAHLRQAAVQIGRKRHLHVAQGPVALDLLELRPVLVGQPRVRISIGFGPEEELACLRGVVVADAELAEVNQVRPLLILLRQRPLVHQVELGYLLLHNTEEVLFLARLLQAARRLKH